MIEFGEMKSNVLQQTEFIGDSIPGRVYQLSMSYTGTIKDPEVLVNSLSEELSQGKYRGAKLYYIEIDEDNKFINIQLSGSPFAWEDFLAYLPLVMTVSGIALVGVSLFDVLMSIPSWAWGILAIGGVLILASPLVAKWAK